MKIVLWKSIIGYEGLYEVSNMGDVKSLSREKQLGDTGRTYVSKEFVIFKGTNKGGYVKSSLTKDGKSKMWLNHRLVALHFIDKEENRTDVNHINGIRSDNRLENLEWVNRRENVTHGHARIRDKNYQIGVYFEKRYKHWYVKMWVDSLIRDKYIGSYKTREEAVNVAREEIRKRGIVNKYSNSSKPEKIT